MPCDELIVERVRRVLKDQRGIGERRMFGGVCFTLNGQMLCGVVKSDLVVRVGLEKYSVALKAAHAREMDFTGRPMKGYLFVSAQGIARDVSLRNWLNMALAFVAALPPKSVRPSRKLPAGRRAHQRARVGRHGAGHPNT